MTHIYAVTYTEQIYHEGDQRSRDYPGHGYPAYTEDKLIFKAFKNEKEFKDWIIEETNRQYSKKTFRAYKCTPIEIKTELTFEFKE